MKKEMPIEQKKILSAETLALLERKALSIPLETGEFELNGTHYYFDITESVNSQTGELNGKPAEYSHPSDSWDIYLGRSTR